MEIMWISNNIDILCIWCNIKEKSPTVALDGLVFHALDLSTFGFCKCTFYVKRIHSIIV